MKYTVRAASGTYKRALPSSPSPGWRKASPPMPPLSSSLVAATMAADIPLIRSAKRRPIFTPKSESAHGARLLVIGPPWVDENVPNNILTIRDRLKIAATKAGATFVDPIADEWFFGADAALIGSDGVHPTDAGVQYTAERILPSSRASSHPSGSCTGLRTRTAGLLSSMGSRPRIPRSKRSARSVRPWGEGHELAGQLLEFGHCPVNSCRARAVRIGDVIEVAVADEILRRTIGVEFRQP